VRPWDCKHCVAIVGAGPASFVRVVPREYLTLSNGITKIHEHRSNEAVRPDTDAPCAVVGARNAPGHMEQDGLVRRLHGLRLDLASGLFFCRRDDLMLGRLRLRLLAPGLLGGGRIRASATRRPEHRTH